jgi:hypothetical protein
MPEHQCNKEKEISEIHEMLTRIDHGLRGNGKPGLFTEFAVWKSTVCGLIALDIIIVAGLVGLWLKQ